MRLCAAQKRTVLTYKIKVFLRDEFKSCDESLHLKTHRRTEKTCDPIFFSHVSFNAFVHGAETHGFAYKIKVFPYKIKVFLRDEFKLREVNLV